MASLVLKDLATVPLRVDVAIPPEKPLIEGFIMCHAVIRSKPDMEQLHKDFEDGKYDEENTPEGEEKQTLLSKNMLFTGVDGLAVDGRGELFGDEAFDEATKGKWSMYIATAMVRKYFSHFLNDAAGKNSKRFRGRS